MTKAHGTIAAANAGGHVETPVPVVRSASLKALLDQREEPDRLEVPEVVNPTVAPRVEFGYD